MSSTPPVFERGRWISFAAFRSFEDYLLRQRSEDRLLSDALRVKSEAWMKLRNEEVYPAWYFIRHRGLPEATEYRLTAEGADADVELKIENTVHRLQITTAGPLWPDGPTNWGADHILHMQQLNQLGESSGWGPYRRNPDGTITNRDEAISSEERNPAYLQGLIAALRGKAMHSQPDCDLLVYAHAYDQAMSVETFENLVRTARQDVSMSGFRSVVILAAGDGYCCS